MRSKKVMVILNIFLSLVINGEGGVLFLAHYNKTLNADFSITGKNKAEVKEVFLTTGGKGYSFTDSNPSPECADIGYSQKVPKGSGIYYDSSNIDVRQGTIQMWVKTNWDWDSSTEERIKKINKSRVFFRVKLKGGKYNSINLMFHCAQGGHFLPLIFFYIYDGKNDYACSYRVGHDSSADFNWHKDIWHYIVATWTPTTMALYVDGKKVAKRTFEIPMDCPLPEGPIVIGNSGHNGKPAGALIDEVRILDDPLNEEQACKIPNMELTEVIKGPAIAAAGPASFLQPEVRTYYSYIISEPPVIDGKLSDKCWENIPMMTGFLSLGIESKLSKYQTEVKCGYDEDNIYLGIFAYEDKIENLKTKVSNNQNMGVFGDDAIEILLSCEEEGKPFIQIGINPKNAICALYYSKEGRKSFWSGKIKSAVSILNEEKGWSIEIAIPFSEFKKEVKAGTIWMWNVCRDRRAGGGLEYSSMNFVSSSFLEPSQFGKLIFSGEPKFSVSEEEVKINREYLDKSRKEMEEFIFRAKKEIKAIGEVSEVEKKKHGVLSIEKKLLNGIKELENILSQKEYNLKNWNRRYFELISLSSLLNELSFKGIGLGITVSTEEIKDFFQKTPGIYEKNKFYLLVSDYLIVSINKKNGVISGIWEKKTGKKLVSCSYDIYYGETRNSEWKSDERLNEVISIKREDKKIMVKSVNSDFPGLTFSKTYFLSKINNEDRIFVYKNEIRGKTKETILFKTSSNTIFDDEFKKDSFYDRIFVIGTAGDKRQQIWAKEIKEPIKQRAWFISEEGRAQFSILNPEINIGLGQYLYKFNNRWIYPQGLAQSWWHQFGWEMGGPGEFFKNTSEKKFSYEIRYHLFYGDRLTFHKEYINLPEYQKIINDWTPHPELRKVKFTTAPNLDNWAFTEKRKKELEKEAKIFYRKGEISVGLTGPYDKRWGVFPASDEEKIVILNRTGKKVREIPCKLIKERISELHKIYPAKVCFYRFIAEIYKGAPVYKEHPEWILKDKKGNEIPAGDFPSCVYVNWHPKYMEYILEKLLREVDYFDLDIIYLDFPIGKWEVDWGREKVISLHVYQDWLKKLYSELRKRNKMLWLNSFVGQYYYDIGFHEGDECRQPWRVSGNVWLMRKIYTRKGNLVIPLYWRGGEKFVAEKRYNEERYRNLVLATGLKSTGCWLDPYHVHFPDGKGGIDYLSLAKYTFPVHETTYELIPSEFVDIGLEPAWWRDFQTEYEGYTLKQGNTYLLNVISHYKNVVKTTDFILKPELMNFKKGGRVFIWQYYARNQKDFVKTAPQPPGWEKMFKKYKFQTFILNEPILKITLENLEPETVRMTSITQIPAFIYAVNGRKTQLLLSDNLDCSVKGQIDEKQKVINLKIDATQPITVIVYTPFKGRPNVESVEKGQLNYSMETISGIEFIKFDVEKGNWNVKIIY